MYNLIEKFIKNMTKEDIKNFAIKKGADLSENELDFTYTFIKNNYQNILKNPSLLDLERYKSHYTKENFQKINQIFEEYYQKYSRYL